MGVRRFNVGCDNCGVTYDLIFRGDAVPNYGMFLIRPEIITSRSCRNCRRKSVGYTPGHTLAGEAYNASREGQFENALRMVKRSLELASESAYVQNQACYTFQICEDYDQANRCGLKAVKLAPEWMDPYTNLGDVAMELGNPQEAIEYYAKAIQIDSIEPLTYASIAASYSHIGDRTNSILNYNKYIDGGGREPAALYNAADENQLIKQYSKAKELYNLALSLVDKNSQLANIINNRLDVLN